MSKPRILPEIRVSLERARPGQRTVRLDYPANLGLRTKLGGEPDWIQNDDIPDCPHCGKAMTFVGQIDSIEHDSRYNPLGKDCLGEKDYMFGAAGMIYVFFCFACCQPACVHQCY